MDINKLAFTDEEIRSKMQKSPSLKNVYAAAKAAEKMKDWEIGMVLVQRRRETGEIITNNAGVPEKYIVVNKLGPLPICKRLMVNGKPGKGLYCPAVEEDEWYTFEEDPDVADSMILGFDYDPMEYPKKVGKARERARNYNNKRLLWKYLEDQLSNTSDDRVQAYIEDQVLLNDGIDVWYMEDDNSKKPLKITGINNQGHAVFQDEKGNNDSVRIYSLTSKYSGYTYFIEEPRTLNEELEKIK